MKKLLYTILGAILLIGASWLVTCSIFMLICLCFDMEFTFRMGTGVWLSLFLLGTALNISNKK